MIECGVGKCTNDADLKYVWAWGEEGACCLAHRATLESQAAQLGRTISFSELRAADTNPRGRAYSAPELVPLPQELGAAKMRVAELNERVKELEQENETLRQKISEFAAAARRAPVEGA